MRHPFQCLAVASQTDAEGPTSEFFLAAAGPQLYCYNLSKGTQVSTWPDKTSSIPTAEAEASTEPPRKRQKKSAEPGTAEGGGGNGTQEDAKAASLDQSNVIKLVASHSGKHVVAVTGEDKAIRVFSLTSEGLLQEVSKRCVPKRPCAIALAADDSTIICADKFGDVYALPLLVESTLLRDSDQTPLQTDASTAAPKTFVPSANALTVHTARNHKALQNQLKSTNPVSEKKGPDFDYQLLLGHVSMLTDLVLIKPEAAEIASGSVEYIISCDRDEHIRVSRGPPQSHIIEGFCLGHTDFVSRICLLEWQKGLLVSGGGDGNLFLWDLETHKVLQRVNLKKIVDESYGLDKYPSRAEKIAVSGIWSLGASFQSDRGRFVVACEGIPALFLFDTCGKKLEQDHTYRLEGNVVDVSRIGSDVIVSVDPVHELCSTTTVRDVAIEGEVMLQTLSADESPAENEDDHAGRCRQLVTQVNQEGSFEIPPGGEKGIRELLYNFESLRKRGEE